MKKKLTLTLKGNQLTARTASGISRNFAFPAAAISISGQRIEVRTPAGAPEALPGGGWRCSFADGPCRFTVTVTPGKGEWFFKEVEVTSGAPLPTPDYLEVDHQKTTAPGIRSCGYRSTRVDLAQVTSEEEGSGVVPGCGYPLAGDDLFTGLEHPAAFNTLLETAPDGSASWQLRHFPVWDSGKITSVRAVTGLGTDIRELFQEYMDGIRLPKLTRPFFNFCTFWSDPYLGDFEYRVEKNTYTQFLNAFNNCGLHPECYTLDAGWQARRSFHAAKSVWGGEKALQKFCRQVRNSGSVPGLWVSPNGPCGMTPDFLRSQGVPVGGGISCHYSGPNYGVLLDGKLEELLTRRFCELASRKYGVRFFKVDWDNECATTPEFDALYPTRDHVREGSINMMARINKALRNVDPGVLTRNGRWPSPWHLMLTTHISLADGGDCEYDDFPSLSQRDSASTHRDTLYYCTYTRDDSFMPLDVYDNHEFGHAQRNPFQESPGVWSNSCVWAIMRGSSYHQFTLQPESLEKWQIRILGDCMQLLRDHTSQIVTGRSRMTGGNPSQGEIYGFRHPDPEGEFIWGLRNPSPMPQSFTLPEDVPFYEQSYPDMRFFTAGTVITFAPHEVKVLRTCQKSPRPKRPYPCQLFREEDGVYACRIPASSRPGGAELHRIPELQKLHADTEVLENGSRFTFGVRVPYRMRNFRVCFKLTSPRREDLKLSLFTSRHKFCRSSAYGIPVSEVPWGNPGMGQRENPETAAVRDASYFTAELPQGGEVFCRLELQGAPVAPEELTLWVTGFEAPAEIPEKKKYTLSAKHFLPPPHPEGFPLNLRLW